MLRIKANKLIQRDGFSYFRNVLFTGVSFFVTDNEVTIYKKKIYKNGIVVDDYNNEIITQRHQGLLEIDFGELDWDPEASTDMPYYQSKLFKGTAYVFKDDTYCTEEIFYLDDFENPDIALAWDIYGELDDISVYDFDDDLFQEQTRYHNKIIKETYASFKEACLILKYTPEGKLHLVEIEKNYFEILPLFKERLYFEVIEDRSFIETIKIDDTFLLFGDSIDDEFINSLCLNKDIESLKELSIRRTSCTIKSLRKLLSLPKLEKLDIKHDDYTQSQLEILKIEYPYIEIIFNKKEL